MKIDLYNKLMEKYSPEFTTHFLSVAQSSQKPLFSLALENTPAIVFRDSGIVWVIHLLFGSPLKLKLCGALFL